MDKTRILPPRVRGRVTGVLDFFVDEIRLFRNILLLTDNFDFVLQVQWWGEILPAFIRPKELKVEGRTNRNSHILESYYHSAQYEIKTTLDLFKNYLNNCEVLELSVLEVFENYVIGSAFLRDLINVLNGNNKLIRMPIFDYLGEEIGEVIVHVNFLQKPQQDTNQNKSVPNITNYGGKISDKKDSDITNKIKSTYFTLGEKTIFYDGHSKKNYIEVEPFLESELPKPLYDFKRNERIANSSLSLPVSEASKNFITSQEGSTNYTFAHEGEESTCTCLPEIQTLKDSSKVLYFGISSQKSRHKTATKKPGTKINSKFNSNSIKCKSKNPEKLGVVSSDKCTTRKSVTKKPEVPKTLTKTVNKIKKEEKCDLRVSSNEFVKLETHPLCEPENDKDIPSKQSPNVNVLDYLLGSDMNKDDEETALNDFKKMSPTHNLVDSINQLCIMSDNDSKKFKCSINSSPSLKRTLNFNFNNPIERTYYEKFFLNSNSSPDFEVAELLNQPANSVKLGKTNPNEIQHQTNEYHINNLQNVNKFSVTERGMKEDRSNSANMTGDKVKNSCGRCKYYKKISELDTIIESLKHFEQKMLLYEKELQSNFQENTDMLIKKNQRFSD